MRNALISFTLALAAIAACVGSDPDPVTTAPDAGPDTSTASSSSSGAVEGGSGSSTSSSSSSGDAASDAPVDTGPTCKPSTHCQDVLTSEMKNDCTPKLSSCNSTCGDDAGCQANCKTSFNSCGSTHRSECLTCATGEHSCDPDKDCYVPVM